MNLSNKNPCKRTDLTSFIQAYSVATKTENQILMGLSGDALNKMLDTLTFREDMDESRKVLQKEEQKAAETMPLPKPMRKTIVKKDEVVDF